jgi:hypothetical protein
MSDAGCGLAGQASKVRKSAYYRIEGALSNLTIVSTFSAQLNGRPGAICPSQEVMEVWNSLDCSSVPGP